MRTRFSIVIPIAVNLILVAPLWGSAQTCSAIAWNNPTTTCISSDLKTANANTNGPAVPGYCSGTSTTYGVWYSFTATVSNPTIVVSNQGNTFSASTPLYAQVFSGATCDVAVAVSGACGSGYNTNIVIPLSGLSTTAGANNYFVRLYYVTSTAPKNTNASYTMCMYNPPANDEPATPGSLTSSLTCSPATGTLTGATASSTAGLPVACVSGTHYDVWYTFTATSPSESVTISSLGTGINNPEVQIYSGAPGSFTSVACGTTTASAGTFVKGSVYYVRVSNVSNDPSPNGSFSICVQDLTPSNDDPSGAASLTSAATCSNTSATLSGATPTGSLPSGCESTGTHYDVWYKFTATATTQLVTISALGANITNPEMQLYSSSSGTLTASITCGTTSVASSGLTAGAVYYVRVSNVGSNPFGSGTAGNFSICVTAPAPATVYYSKSYINVSKGATGGTIDPGDTLEIRATFAIKSGTADSLAFYDTLYNGKGFALVPGSIALRTNEDKVYKSLTDIYDGDGGWYSRNGLDTTIQINFGTGATNVTRGRLSNTSKPSVFNSTCIIMATYKVVVNAPYNTLINFRTGSLTYKDVNTSLTNVMSFKPDNLMVYKSPGLCPNAISPTNALGAESNGTFGTPVNPAPLLRNRGTSPYTNYAYMAFTSGGGPNDFYYGIANNTSQNFTTLNTWAKPDVSPTHRVFNFWDIIGDHTGATNTSKGNMPCDTTQPVSATNPCGYMLVINSAYKTDTAFQYTVTNLCPNTYYEISAWFRNICYKCGCDSNGVSATGTGYIPYAPGDSSGVQPNIAFDVNGTDYYTTGDIRYVGVTQAGSDSTNKWFKRGFTYLTGTNESSFTLTLRNNAPGGGGNDWALDDIGVNTCLPNMQYSPTVNPSVCQSNVIQVNDTIRSYFNNQNYYKWQKSADNGTTWADISGASGSATPVWNGSAYQYIASYTIPNTSTQTANNGDLYRVMVATTAANISNSNCQFTDGVSKITLSVLNCGTPLSVQLLNFNGKLTNNYANLLWTTTNENEPISFEIERSTDQNQFTLIGRMRGHGQANETNYYNFTDTMQVSGKVWYRIAMIDQNGVRKYTRTIMLENELAGFDVAGVINPFNSSLQFDVTVKEDVRLQVTLMTVSGTPVRKQSFRAYSGMNSYTIPMVENLQRGVYLLQINYKDQNILRKVLKY